MFFLNLLELKKHIGQIKKGGGLVFIKKIISFFYLILQIPIYLISIPTVVTIRLIRPWFLIRWQELLSSRIGHFSVNTELYCCERDAGINTPSQRYLDVFYLKKYVCNNQMEKMWRRNLIILPRWLLFPLFIVNRFISRFVSGRNYAEVFYDIAYRSPETLIAMAEMDRALYETHEIGYNANGDRDIYNLLDQSKPHINFTYNEEAEGKRLLTQFGLPEGAKFVCLNVRDSAYLDRYKKSTIRDWKHHNYRDGDIDNYVFSCRRTCKKRLLCISYGS